MSEQESVSGQEAVPSADGGGYLTNAQEIVAMLGRIRIVESSFPLVGRKEIKMMEEEIAVLKAMVRNAARLPQEVEP